jgi:hypothetical protein
LGQFNDGLTLLSNSLTDVTKLVSNELLNQIVFKTLPGIREILLTEVYRFVQYCLADANTGLQFAVDVNIGLLAHNAPHFIFLTVTVSRYERDFPAASQGILNGPLFVLAVGRILAEGDVQGVSNGFKNGGFAASTDANEGVELWRKIDDLTVQLIALKGDTFHVRVFLFRGSAGNTVGVVEQREFDRLKGERANLDICLFSLPDVGNRFAVAPLHLGGIPPAQPRFHLGPLVVSGDFLETDTSITEQIGLSYFRNPTAGETTPEAVSRLHMRADQEVVSAKLIELTERFGKVVI